MKTTIRNIILAAALLVMPLAGYAYGAEARAFAQDDEKCADCIISSVLEKLPADNAEDFNALMEKLSTVADESVHALASMLAPAEEGENAVYEYALNGLVAYASASGREELATEVRQALFDSIDECEGDSNKAFLLSLTRLTAGAQDVAQVEKYLGNDYLKPFAISLLVSIPDIDDEVLSLVKKSSGPDAALAYLAGTKGIAGAEKYLLKWIPSDDATLCENVYAALGSCGSRKSLEALAAAAEADGYGLGKTNATESYLKLVRRLVEEGDSKGWDEAQSLLKSEYTHIRVNALDILLHGADADRTDLLLTALQDEDKEYRCAALFAANGFADDALYEAVASQTQDLTNAANVDVITWLGERGAAGQIATVVAATTSPYPPLAAAAIRAAGRIGGDDALSAIAACLDGPNAEEAEKVLGSFKGDITATVLACLDGSPKVQAAALRLAGQRRIKSASAKAIALTSSSDVEVCMAAYWALSGVCTEADFDSICDILDKCYPSFVTAVQVASITTGRDVGYARISARYSSSSAPERYYPLLAENGDVEAVGILIGAAKEGLLEAFSSLLKVDAPIAGELIELGTLNDKWTDRAASRACDLIQKYVAPADCAAYYSRALDLKPSAKVTKRLLNALGDSADKAGIGIALGYTDDPETMEAAAYVIKTVASKNPELLSDEAVRAALEKARDVYSVLSASDADAGYAVDEINLLLSK